MALQTPTSAQISWQNLVADYPNSTVLSVTSEQTQWRATNLLSPMRSKRWRSTSAAQQSIALQLGAGVVFWPGVFALIDSNLRSGQAITLEMSDESTINPAGSGYGKWNLTSYAQSKRRVLRFYTVTPDVASNPYVARPFAKITLPANGTDDTNDAGVNDPYHELGLPWFGQIGGLGLPSSLSGILLDQGLTRRILDPSIVAEVDSGARYVDPKPTYHEVDADTSYMPEAQSKTMMRDLDECGIKRHVLFDIWAPRTDATLISQGAYYGYLANSDTVAEFEAMLGAFDNTGLRFVEARA